MLILHINAQGEKYSPYRMLRAVKNRFGSTDEVCYCLSHLRCLPWL